MANVSGLWSLSCLDASYSCRRSCRPGLKSVRAHRCVAPVPFATSCRLLAGSRAVLMVDRFSSYHGEMKKGKPHGRGTKTWPDGTEYRGEFALGKEVPEASTRSEQYPISAVDAFLDADTSCLV